MTVMIDLGLSLCALLLACAAYGITVANHRRQRQIEEQNERYAETLRRFEQRKAREWLAEARRREEHGE